MKDFSFDASLEAESQHHDYGHIWPLPSTFVIDKTGILRKNGWYGAADID